MTTFSNSNRGNRTDLSEIKNRNLPDMSLYEYTPDTLSFIKEKPFKLEKEIQTLFEKNLPLIMGVEMVKSEFTIKDRRIDTLGFDPQTKAFVIIEYKRERNASVIDQGFTYLSLMLQHQADFILEYNETQHKNLKRSEVDWSQTRVVFVSQGFTQNQREAVNFKDLSIELWEVKRYANNSLTIQPIRKSHSSASIKTVMQNSKEYKEVAEQIRSYSEENLLQGKSDEVAELYETYKNAILNLDTGIETKPQKLYISFWKGTQYVCSVQLQNSSLKTVINLPKGRLDDSKELARDISHVGHWGMGDYEVKVSDTRYLEYIMSLIKQAL